MKSVAEPVFIGLVGTLTIMAGIIIAPLIVKTTIDKETLFNYGYEKIQHALLTLFYLSQDGRSGYEILSQKALFESFDCNTDSDCPNGYTCDTNNKCTGPTTGALKERLDKIIENYCITTEIPLEALSEPTEDQPPGEVLKRACTKRDIQFTTIVVLPYNRDSLTKLMRIGIG